MDPNLNSFPILSYVLSYVGPTTTEPPIVDQFPQLKDPSLLAAMTKAVSEVSQTQTLLQTLGPRPDHVSITAAKSKLTEIETSLSKSLSGLVLSPRPSDVDRFHWRSHLAEQGQECRDKADKETVSIKSLLQLEDMYVSYDKLLKDTENQLVKLCENSNEIVEQEVDDDCGSISSIGMDCVDLSKRKLKSLPDAFWRINCLRLLNLSNNLLEVIPEAISGLSSLEEFNVSSNHLELLPDSIGLLSNLKVLNVSQNRLAAIPDSICGCKSLVELDISFNRVRYLPTNIGYELVNLQKLSIHLNKIRSLPTSIGEMRSLRHLDAHFNELCGLPVSIGGLTNLEVLNVSSNFSDLNELPETIGDLIKLREIDLSNNQISCLPVTFGRLENLVKLNLDQNPIEIPPIEIVQEGVDSVKEFMAKRWLDILVEEERKNMVEVQEEEQTGWMRRSSSWLKNYASGVKGNVSEYVATMRSSRNPDFNTQR
ncbi:hypothetical protein ACFE04_020096 [Oxalis oulophora]